MAEFKSINTQEELDAIIKDRLERAERKVREEFKGWTSPDDLKALTAKHSEELQKLTNAHSKELEKYADVDQKITAQTNRIHELEVSGIKQRIAMERRMPMEAIEFLQGDDADSINASADKLIKLSSPTSIRTFERNTEAAEENSDREWKELLSKISLTVK